MTYCEGTMSRYRIVPANSFALPLQGQTLPSTLIIGNHNCFPSLWFCLLHNAIQMEQCSVQPSESAFLHLALRHLKSMCGIECIIHPFLCIAEQYFIEIPHLFILQLKGIWVVSFWKPDLIKYPFLKSFFCCFWSY